MSRAQPVETVRYLPGFLVLVAIGVSSYAVGQRTPLSPLVVAVGVGVVLANSVGLPEWAQPGIAVHGLLLETGIVLLGAQLSVAELTDIGPTVVGLAIGVVILGVGYAELLARTIFGLRRRTGSLLAAGASVCGVSAVVAVAGTIDADERDIAYVAATVLLFDAVTLISFPVVGRLLGLSGETFGIWAGLSMFSTGPAAAAGFVYSQAAGQWATVTKLVRNTLIGALVVGYSVVYTRSSNDLGEAWDQAPKFIIGFVLVVLLANTGVLTEGHRETVVVISDWLFIFAFAGLGFDISISEMADTGVRPVVLVLVHLLTVSALTLAVLVTIF